MQKSNFIGIPKNKFSTRILILLTLGSFAFLSFLILGRNKEAALNNSDKVGLKLISEKAESIFKKIKTVESVRRVFSSNADEQKASNITSQTVIPVLLLACNRPEVLRAIKSLLKYKNSANHPIIVSQDCNHDETFRVISAFTDSGQVIHLKQPHTEAPAVEKGNENLRSYYSISRHYKWALTQVFDSLGFDQVIVMEDDMEISPDFYDYFSAFLPVLKQDSSLMCISSWNDNGKYANSSSLFYRTDFFPGLGWMLTKNLWLELKQKWPSAFWDDWLREPEQRKGRACIRPELSRTLNFGRHGVSSGLYFNEHIASVKTNQDLVEFMRGNDASNDDLLSNYWSIDGSRKIEVQKYAKDHYDSVFLEQVYVQSTRITSEQLLALLNSDSLQEEHLYKINPNALIPENINAAEVERKFALSVNSPYYCGDHCIRRYTIIYRKDEKWEGFVKEAKKFKIMDDIRAGQARTSFLGIVCLKAYLKNPVKMTLFQNNIERNKIMLDRMETEFHVCLAPPEPNYVN